ncbi:unnamed protein product, partial [Sphenostylis stenocarpa]
NRKQRATDGVIEFWIARELELGSESGCVVEEGMKERDEISACDYKHTFKGISSLARATQIP